MSAQPTPVKLDQEKRVIAKSSTQKVASWRVTLGKRITGDKKHRRFFKTYKAAQKFIDDSLAAQIIQGTEAFSIPQKVRVEAMECAKKLEPLGVSLTTAVDYFIRHASPGGGVRTFDEAKVEFLTSRRAMNCKPKTLTQYESYLKILGEEFGKLRMNEIKRPDIEDWLAESEWASRTRKNYLVTLTTLFNFAMSREYCVANPAAKLERPILDDKPPGILTPDQAATLLSKAVEKMPEMVSGIAIGLFAGLRRSEICALDWSEVSLSNSDIEVKGISAKTRQRRIVSVSENLALWLKRFAKRRDPVAPPVDEFGERLNSLSQSASIKPWPHNACRHSFGSYFYSKTKNENLTAAEMGNSPAVVHRHYRALVREKEAEEYFNSGQQITDPFLALLKKVFWNTTQPTVTEGVFAVLWTLLHVIEFNTGGINGPPQIAVLKKSIGNQLQASLLDDAAIAEHTDSVKAAEQHLAKFKETQLTGSRTIPAPPASAGGA